MYFEFPPDKSGTLKVDRSNVNELAKIVILCQERLFQMLFLN